MVSKSILISGGLGFIGRSLTEKLKNSNNITIIDNLSSSKLEKIFNVKILIGNVEDKLETLDPNDFDVFYHLGEFSRVEQSFKNFSVCMKSNFGPISKVLEFCRKGEIKLIYSGSSTKFTKETIGKQLSPYAWSKSINTELIVRYADWYKLNYAICYFYNVYGPGELSVGNYSTVIGKFIAALKKGAKVNITSPGNQIRNFTHIEDTVNGLMLVGEKAIGDGYCIAHPKSYSIIEVAEMLGLNYEMIPEHRANRMASDFDLSSMQSLGWSAEINLKTYLQDILQKL